jgi:hypothetical protein
MKQFLLPILLFLVSCSSSKPVPVYQVYIDSISAESASGKSFVIFSGMNNISDEDLTFKKNAQAISLALQEAGYKHYEGDELADVMVFVGYSVSEPRINTQTRLVKSYNRQSVDVNNVYGQKLGTLSGWTPTTNAVVESYNTYLRHVVVRAVDVKTKKELWKTEAFSEGSSDDINTALLFMVKAAYPHFGTNTGGRTLKEIVHSEENLQYLRKPASIE